MPDPANTTFGAQIEDSYFDRHDILTEVPAERDSRIIAGAWGQETPHGLPVDLHYQANHTPWDAIPPLFVGEDQILKDLIRMTVGSGIGAHHPAVAQVVFQSLQPYPELADAYLQS